jgi:hypothetical protein
VQVSHQAHGLFLTEESDVELAWKPAAEAVGRPAAEREIRVPGVATFRVSGGCRVTIDRVVGADPVEVEASLAGRVSAALLQQRRTLPLHLAAVAVGSRAVGFVGPPGSGKSSLACALGDRGHPLVTDDLGAVTDLAGGSPVLHPGPPVMRIWGPSARQLGWPTDDGHRIKQGVDKYAYEQPDRFADRPHRLGAVYVLLEDARADLQIVPVTGFAKFEAYFSGATYNREFLDDAAARAWHFETVCRIADQVPTFMLRVPAGGAALSKLATEVERHAGSLRGRA